jgi:hypothetical protein
MLTNNELEFLELTEQLISIFHKILSQGKNHNNDGIEMINKIHDIQNVVLSQSAAREYPDKFRLLGD